MPGQHISEINSHYCVSRMTPPLPAVKNEFDSQSKLQLTPNQPMIMLPF